MHIEDFTRARVDESDLTAVLVETGALPVQPLVVEGVCFNHT